MVMLALVGGTPTPFDSLPMKNFMGRFKNISSPNICNHVHFFKSSSYAHKGSIDKILELKSRIHIDFIQDSTFLGHGSSKMFLFKMSSGSLGSRVDLVRRMQLGGNLQEGPFTIGVLLLGQRNQGLCRIGSRCLL